MLIVADASFCLAFLLRDFPETQLAEADRAIHLLQDKNISALVPMHFPLEVANVICMAYRRGRLGRTEYENRLKALELFPYKVQTNLPVQSVAALAEKHHLSFYDAAYLELALCKQATYLFTFDNAMIQAATAEGLAVRIT